MNVGTIIRAVTDLPARLFGGNAQKVEVSGLDYTLHLDLEKLPVLDPVGEAPGKWTVIWDEVANTYRRVEFTDLPPPSGYNTEVIDARVAQLLKAGANVSLVYNDTANTLTIHATSSVDAEAVDDRVAQLLKAGNNVALVYDDNDSRLTIHAASQGGSTGPQNVFDTLTDAKLANVPAAVKNMMLMGYSKPGDAGPAMPCRRTATMVTVHNGVFRTADRYTDDGSGIIDSANGGWWEYVGTNQPVWIEWFGGKADHWVPESRTGGVGYTGRPAKNPTPTDNWQPIIDASKFFWAHVGFNVPNPDGVTWNNYFDAGPTLQFGIGGYFCSQTLTFDRALTMLGMGMATYHDYHLSQIYFPPGVMGINAVPGSAVFLKDIYFSGQSVVNTPVPIRNKHGLQMQTQCYVEACAFHGFSGHGIEIFADVGGGSNANLFYLDHVTCYGNARSGVHCQGGDANAGVGFALNLMENGEWGIDDYSFLGNSWYGVHTSGNGNGYVTGVAALPGEGGAYRGIGGGGQACTFYNCYAESDQSYSVVNAPAMVVGGLHANGISGSGILYIGSAIRGEISFISPYPEDQIGVTMRRYPNNIMRIAVPTTEYLFKWNAGQGIGYQMGDAVNQHIWFIADYANTHTAGRAEPIEGGGMVAPWGVYIGDVWNETRQVGTTNADAWNFNASFFQGSTLSQWARSKCYAVGDVLADYNGNSKGLLFCTRSGGYGVNWIAGRSYTPDDANAHVHHIVTNSAGRTYRCMGPPGGGGAAANEPVHTSGTVTEADGYIWKFLSEQRAVFKSTLLMGQEGTTVNDPRISIAQNWNNAAINFTGTAHYFAGASGAASTLAEWWFDGAKKAEVRKDGTFLSNGTPVVMAAELDELRSTIAALQDRIATLETRHGH